MRRYEKLEQIGKGSFSSVWLAKDAENEFVVLKQFNSTDISEARREYLFLLAAEKVNAPEALDFYQDAEGVWLVMQYIAGDQVAPEKFKSIAGLDRFYFKLLEQVMQLHSLGICLNDLKPENIIVRDNEPWLLDFGLATPNNYNDGIFRGNLAYSSPEKYLFKSCHTGSDIFSLGILYYYLQTGKHPSESIDKKRWQELLSDRQQWEEWQSEQELDENISGMLNWSVIERTKIEELINSFAEKTGKEGKQISGITENYHFGIQERLAKRLLENNILRCSRDDGYLQIAELAQLHGESEGRQLIIIDETQLVSSNEEILAKIQRLLSKELKSINELADARWHETGVLIIRDADKDKTPFIKSMQNRPNLFSLILDGSRKAGIVDKEDYARFRKLAGLDEESEYSGLSVVGARLKVKLERQPSANIIENPLSMAAAELNCWIPLNLAAMWEDNWAVLLSDGIKNGNLILSGSSFKLADNFNEKSEAAKFAIYAETAENNGYYYIAGKLYFTIKDSVKGKELLIKQYRKLIKSGAILSAWQLIEELEHYLSWNDFGFKLQKAYGYLARQLGDIELSLSIYRRIPVKEGSEQEAVINSDMAISEQESGNYKEAESLYQRALEYFRKTGNKKSELRSLNNLAAVYYEEENYNRCSTIYQEIIRITEQNSDIDYARNYNLVAQINLADVFLHKAQWQRSRIYARNAASIADKLELALFRIRAEVIAILAQYAQNREAVTKKMLTEFLDDEIFSENPQLYSELLVYILPVLQEMDAELAYKIVNEQIEKNGFNFLEEQLISFFFVCWQKRDSGLLSKLLDNITSMENRKLTDPLYSADIKEVLKNLRELNRGDDCWRYINYCYQLALAGWHKIEEINSELKAALELYSFEPLKAVFDNRNESAPAGINLLWEIVSMIHNKVEFKEIISEVLRGLIRVAGLDRALFFKFDEGKLIPEIGYNNKLDILDITAIQVSETLLLQTLEAKEIRYFTGLQDEDNFDIHSSIFGLGLRTAVCYPLHFEKKIQGVIYSDAKTEKDFDNDVKKLMESILVQGKSAYEKVIRMQELSEKQISQLIVEDPATDSIMQGKSEKMRKIFNLISTIAQHNVNVLITGETGTGKELIARSIHNNYAKEKPFIPVNCAAIPETLLESELFGYVKGAFTGAERDKKGLITVAESGTLFLDEIGDMPVSLQAKLLRVIQERQVTPLGSNKAEEVNIRIVAATNQNLENLIEKGEFRADLYFRLKVIRIDIPALRERKDDIPVLVQYFITRFNERFQKNVKKISIQALDFLQNQPFPGNVRELENALERAMVLCQTDELTLDLFEMDKAKSGFSLYDNIPVNWEDYKVYKKRFTENLDLVYIRRLLKQTDGNTAAAGKLANISRTQIYRILNSTKIDD